MTLLFRRASAAALAVLTGTAPAFADQAGGGYYYGHPMWSGGWGHMFMGWGMMALFLVAVVVILFMLLRGGGDGRNPARGSSALDILDERYARGEIDTAEYTERRKTIADRT